MITDNLYNAKLKVVGTNETAFYDLLKMSESIKVGSTKLDYKINDGSRFGGVLTGLGILSSGRSIDISIPVLYKNRQLETVGILKQINKILSMISQAYNNKYYLIYEFDNELYSCEMCLVEAGSYSVKDVVNAGSISLKLQQIDNFYTSEYQTEKIITIGDGEGTNNTQDIEIDVDDTYTPSLCDFRFVFDINIVPFYFYFANRDNYGISCKIDTLGTLKNAVVEYKDKTLLINNVAYAYDGVQFMVNRGKNVLFYESNANALDCRLFYKKSILI